MYAAYLAKNASTDPESQEWKALKRGAFIANPFCRMTPLGQDPELIKDLQICLDVTKKDQSISIIDCQTNITDAYNALKINYLQDMQVYLASPDFTELQNDIERNYTKIHLNEVLKRFSNMCKITVTDQKDPSTYFDGDITDLGIIVNIINNSDQRFQITQTTASNEPIAHIEHGLNNVNLYTTVLTQEKEKDKTIFSFFEVTEKDLGENKKQPAFTVGIYTGKEFISFLKTLPRKDAKIFDMNGCPTSEQYLANPHDSYLVLIKTTMPTRIQAINLSVFTGPYLLTMHINQDDDNGLQPLFVQAQTIHEKNFKQIKNKQVNYAKQKEINRILLPLVILPKFLWDISKMRVFWMLYTTSYIAALTDFSCFNYQKFGSAFDYFNELGYFDTDHEHRFIIDRYNILKPGETLFDANWLMGCALYESDVKKCTDVPGIYSTFDEKNNVVANGSTESHLNFSMSINPKTTQTSSYYFNKTNFDNTYNMPYRNTWPLIFSIPKKIMQESAFLKITQLKSGLYSIHWTNKQNDLLSNQTIKINYSDYKISINALNNKKDLGFSISDYLNQQESGQIKELKVIYKKTNQKDTFEITIATPIDKLQAVYTYLIPEYQIKNLYFDLYQTFNVQPYIKSNIINNGKLPEFLQNLTDQDWQNGVYIVPTLSNHNTGIFSVIFYKSDKTILGSISSEEKSQNIKAPITAYNAYINDLKPMYDIYLSTGILLRSIPQDN